MEEKKVYIATQSPLLNTVEDFWRMVWEQQSRTILMLNPVTQHGKVRSLRTELFLFQQKALILSTLCVIYSCKSCYSWYNEKLVHIKSDV